MSRYTNEQIKEAVEHLTNDPLGCCIRPEKIDYFDQSVQIRVKSRSGKESHILHYEFEEDGHLNVWGGYSSESSKMKFAHQLVNFLQAL